MTPRPNADTENCARCGFPRSEHRVGYSRSRCEFITGAEWMANQGHVGSPSGVSSEPTGDESSDENALERELKAWRWLHWGKTDAAWACRCGNALGHAIDRCDDCGMVRPAKGVPLNLGFPASRSSSEGSRNETSAEQLRQAIRDRDVAAAVVRAEIREAGARGELRTNGEAPSWPRYAEAEQAFDRALAAFSSATSPGEEKR